MQDACHNELSKYDLACHESPSSSVVSARPVLQEVMGSIPVRDSDFFFVPCSWQTEYSIFLIIIIISATFLFCPFTTQLKVLR